LHHLEQDSPPLEQLLGQLHQTIADSIRHHSGRVLRHSAEGVLAIFQGPQACLRACEASTLLHQRLSDERALSSWGPVGVGIGLHAGLFHQADILPRQTELIGSAATIPRRLAEAARAGETLCSAVACELANQLWYGESREVLLRGAHRAVVGRPLLTW
jgi:class 3 adenylate cyclase